MRISTSWSAQQSVNTMLDRQYDLSQTQLALGNGKAIQTPADNPAAAARAVDVSSASAQNDQYTRNIQSAIPSCRPRRVRFPRPATSLIASARSPWKV